VHTKQHTDTSGKERFNCLSTNITKEVSAPDQDQSANKGVRHHQAQGIRKKEKHNIYFIKVGTQASHVLAL
jgi:hypothetical protein